MLKLLLRNRAWLSAPQQRFRLEDYTKQDYATMCGLLREKYFLNNDEIQTSGLIKLQDDAGKVIGIYTASEARKKAQSLGLDMVVVNLSSSPVICRASDFRAKLISRFYNEIVLKRQKEWIAKATTVKTLKVSPALNKDEMGLKIKQLVELSNKNLKVRVIMQVSENAKEQSLSKLEWLKSQLLNKCYIQQEISSRRFQELEEEDERNQSKYKVYSFVIKARETNFVKNTLQERSLDPDALTKNFLKKYYQQDDGEMMDLKQAGMFEVESGMVSVQKEIVKVNSKQQRFGDFQKKEDEIDVDTMRQAEARVLNQRLKVLLSLYK